MNLSNSSVIASFSESHNQYSSNKSSTYYADGTAFNLTYGGGQVGGFLSHDVVTVAGISIQNQTFAEATWLDGSTVTNGRYDGIFGLGYASLSSGGIVPPLYRMYHQGLILQPIVSMYLNAQYDAGQIGGQLIFGGSDPHFFTGQFLYANVTRQGYWQFKMDDIYVQSNVSLCANGCEVFADTGTGYIQGPSTMIDKLHTILGTNGIIADTPAFDCAQRPFMPNVTFIIEGAPLYLTAYDYLFVGHFDNGTEFCISNFSPIGDGFLDDSALPQWTLGTPFLSSFYTEFDLANNRLGFAALRY